MSELQEYTCWPVLGASTRAIKVKAETLGEAVDQCWGEVVEGIEYADQWASLVGTMVKEANGLRAETVKLHNQYLTAVKALEESESALAEAKLIIPKNCPLCPDQGWYEGKEYYTGEPEQHQCYFCHETPNSVFNLNREENKDG